MRKFIDELNKLSPFYFIRSDIDDREESVGRKIRDAEKEWIPYIIVVGEKERKEKAVIPRFRINDLGEENRTYTISQLHNLILEQIKIYPQQKLPLPMYLSKRPKFKG